MFVMVLPDMAVHSLLVDRGLGIDVAAGGGGTSLLLNVSPDAGVKGVHVLTLGRVMSERQLRAVGVPLDSNGTPTSVYDAPGDAQ